MLVHFRTKGIPGRYAPGDFTKDGVKEILRNSFAAGWVSEYPTAPLDMSDDDEQLGATNPELAEPKVRDQRIPVRAIPGQHVALIPFTLWQSNKQERLNRRRTPNSINHVRRQYMLAGVGRCWECWAERGIDSPLYGTTGSNHGRRLYLCSWIKARYKAKARSTESAADSAPDQGLLAAQPVSNPVCRHPATRRAEPLEAATTQLVNRLRIPAEWHDAILAYALCDDGVIEFERRTYNLRQELERNQRLFQLSQITEAELVQRAQALNLKLQAVRPSAQPEAQPLAPHLQSFASLWTQLTAGEQRSLLNVMFAGLYFDAENRLRRIVTHAPFTRLLELDAVTEFE